MSIRRLPPFYGLIAAAAVAGTTASFLGAVVLPLDHASADQSALAPRRPPGQSGLPPLSAYAAVWDQDLRRPLTDPPLAPPASIEEPRPEPQPAPVLRVFGTVIEAGRPLAMVAGPDGKTRFLGVGDDVAGAKICAIVVDSVTFGFDGRSIVVAVEKPSPSPSPAAAPAPARPAPADAGDQ